MVRITIDEETRKKLLASGEVVELIDESGKLLGRVLPHKEDSLDGWVPITPELSDEEYQRRMHSDGPTMTTEELLQHLRSRS
ncbi:MAG: hypothetical protein AAGJ46_06050 [Planctomycetota bacterium]